MTPRDEGSEHEAHIEHEIDCAREAAHDEEEIEKATNEICSSCHHSIGYCDCLDEEVDTSDWAVPPETEKMLRGRITNLEARLAELEEKDRVVRGDPSRAAIFDWMNEHKDEAVKTLADQNGEMEREIINLEAVLEWADTLRTASFSFRAWQGGPSCCVDCDPVKGEHEADCGVLGDYETLTKAMNAYDVARTKTKPWITTERLTLAASLPDIGEPGDDL